MRSLIDHPNEAALGMLLRELGESARAHRFEVAPNPCVGAALLRGGEVVARGFHRAWGGPHAEVEAFAAAREAGVDPRDCDTLVVTLEPCSSTGKTPPCVDLVLEAGLQRVVVGALDPDPRHRGHGLERLRDAGVEVALVPGASPLDTVAPHFLRWTALERLRRPRPWTILKWAQTLTGQLSPPEDVGEGRWISGPEALTEVQVLRSRVDAIVTGLGTVRQDDPRLSVRPPACCQASPPLRVVLDSSLRTPPEARLFASPGPGESAGPVVVVSLPGADGGRARALEAAGARVLGLRGTDRKHIDLRAVQDWLWEEGCQRVLVEAGPQLLASYLASGFVDQVRVVTGSVRGGRGESLGPQLSQLRLLERLDREVGDDSVLEAFLSSMP